MFLLPLSKNKGEQKGRGKTIFKKKVIYKVMAKGHSPFWFSSFRFSFKATLLDYLPTSLSMLVQDVVQSVKVQTTRLEKCRQFKLSFFTPSHIL